MRLTADVDVDARLTDVDGIMDAVWWTTAVSGLFFCFAAVAVSAEMADAADVEMTAVCGSSFCFAAAVALEDAAVMMMDVDAAANTNAIPFQQNNFLDQNRVV